MDRTRGHMTGGSESLLAMDDYQDQWSDGLPTSRQTQEIPESAATNYGNVLLGLGTLVLVLLMVSAAALGLGIAAEVTGGKQGKAGATGPPGATGTAGAVGATGSPGPAGSTGPVGSPGSGGSGGGSPGPAGSPGALGATGSPGPAGSTGPAGVTGSPGPVGSPGPGGAIGATGSPGPAGAIGATGSPGPAGAIGATGSPGPVGSPGPSGGGVTADNGLTLTGSNLQLGGTLVATTTINTGGKTTTLSNCVALSVTGLPTDSTGSTTYVLTEDNGGQVHRVAREDILLYARGPTTVYFDSITDPALATAFSLTNPATVNTPGLAQVEGYYYVTSGLGSTGRLFTWNGAAYVEITSTYQAGIMEMGSYTYMRSGFDQDISSTSFPHQFATLIGYRGPSIYFNPADSYLLVRYGGVYEITVGEYIDISSLTARVTTEVRKNGVAVGSRGNIVSTDNVGTSSNGQPYAIVESAVPGGAQVQIWTNSINGGGTPIKISQYSWLSVKQIGYL